MRGKPADPRPAPPVPPGLGTLVPAGHQEGDHGGLPGPPRHAQRRTRQPDTPRTRHLPPDETSAPAAGEHRAAADDLNRPSGLPGPRAVMSGMRGPEGAPVQQCTGATRRSGQRGAARLRADARSSQDLIDGGRRDRDAELGQLAVDPAVVAPQRISFRQANDKAGDAADCRRAAGLALPARVVLSRFLVSSLRCQASSVAGVTGKTPTQCPRGISCASAANHTRSAGS